MILAGGLGTRLGEMTKSLPKPMVPVLGRPFLEFEIDLLKRSGIRNYVLCVGYLGTKVQEHFGDGRRFGVRIRYSLDGPQLMGPAGALRRAEPMLEDSFFVTYGDAYLRADYPGIMARLLESDALGVMATYRNVNRHGRSDVIVKEGKVVSYNKSGHVKGMDWINFGVSALRKEALQFIPPDRPCWEEGFYGELIKRKELLAFPVRKRFYEIGTPQSLKEFERFLRRGGAR